MYEQAGPESQGWVPAQVSQAHEELNPGALGRPARGHTEGPVQAGQSLIWCRVVGLGLPWVFTETCCEPMGSGSWQHTVDERLTRLPVAQVPGGHTGRCSWVVMGAARVRGQLRLFEDTVMPRCRRA